MSSFRRLLAWTAVVAVVGTACSSRSSSSVKPRASGGSPPAGAGGMMAVPSWAKHMKVRIASPKSGAKVTGSSVTMHIAVSGFTDACDLAGKSVQPNTGHYHVLLDKSLVNMFCTTSATVSMQNVLPGMHTLAVVPALNDHAEVMENETSVKIEYRPTNPPPQITGATSSGTPSIQILSPKNGQTLSGPFDVVVRIANFRPSCDLMGKPDVDGYGHWHVNLDSMTGPMMGMGTMVGMSCTNVMHTSTAGLGHGQTHTIIALLTDNAHVPLQPPITDQVTVKIG